MAMMRDTTGLAVPSASIRRGDGVITADGVEIGRVRRVYDHDPVRGFILVLGSDDGSGRRTAYKVPLWAPRRRDVTGARLYLAAHLAHVQTRWLFAAVVR